MIASSSPKAVRNGRSKRASDAHARRAYVDYGLAHPSHYEVVFLLHSGGMPETPVGRLDSGRMSMDLVADLIADGAARGVLRTPLPPLVTAGAVWAMLHGAVSIAIGDRLHPGQNLTTAEVVDATRRSVVAQFVVPPAERPDA